LADSSRIDLRFVASETHGNVSATLWRPSKARALFVLAHGAGADMRHTFMESLSEFLFERDIATFRYQFPYKEAAKRRPDPASTLQATVRRAINTAREHAGDLPIVAGGKSMGGRMTSSTIATEPISGVHGLVFVGFPLHPTGKPSINRSDHLEDVRLPMLFVQGTRDRLAELELLQPICARLSGATLHIVEGGDHSFHVLKRSGRTDEEALNEVAEAIAEWTTGVV